MHDLAICALRTASLLAGGAALLLGAAPVLAQDASRIARVTLYPGVASIERVAKVPAGARRLTLHCLPATLDAASLQISADAGVRLGVFNVLAQERSTVAACASPLDARILALQDQVAAVQAEASALELVNSYLRGVAGAPVAAGQAAAPSSSTSPPPAQVAAMAGVLHKSGQNNFARTHQLQRQQQALELDLAPLLAERERTGGQRARMLTLSVELASASDAELRVSYLVRGPRWQPTYRATLDVAKPGVLLERQAVVEQSSGEDWSNVQLTLSTGAPGQATQGRLPRPWTLDLAPPPAPPIALAGAMAAKGMQAAPSPEMRVQKSANAAELEAAALPVFDVQTMDKGFATEFAVPQRISVPSSNQRTTVALGTYAAPAVVMTRIAPAQEEAAYLQASISAPPGVWPAGPASLYRDGAFVGNGRIDFTVASAGAPAGSASLAFGRDERVLVRAEPPQAQSGSSGWVGSQSQRQVRRAYRIENRHATSITLQVLDAAPVSQNDKIQVQSRYQPTPTDTAWNGQPGLIAWEQALAAGASATFSAEHTIRYPQDLPVVERQ